MNIKILEESSDFMMIQVSDEEQSIINVLTETLNAVNGVLYAGYRVEHPLTGEVTISIKVDSSKTSPRKSLQKAFDELAKIFDKLDSQLEILR